MLMRLTDATRELGRTSGVFVIDQQLEVPQAHLFAAKLKVEAPRPGNRAVDPKAKRAASHAANLDRGLEPRDIARIVRPGHWRCARGCALEDAQELVDRLLIECQT